MRTLAVIAALASLGAMEVNTATPVVRVLECLRANQPQNLSIRDLEIQASGPDVRTPRLGARVFVRRDKQRLQALLQVTAPADLAGTRYLLLERDPEDELYLYVPAIGKVRRISGYGADADIGGTGLNPTDLRVMLQATRGASINLAAPQALAGRMTDTLRLVPAVIDSPFRRVIASVDRETCAVLQVDFHAPQGSTAKLYRADPASLTRSGTHWYASVAQIDDRTRGNQARIALRGVRTDEKISSRRFDPRSFHKLD